jgi:hypothetical protein
LIIGAANVGQLTRIDDWILSAPKKLKNFEVSKKG